MKIKNNSKNLRFIKQVNIKYSISDFFSLDMFNPIIQKNYFDKYDLSLFKNKKFRTHVFGMGGSSLSAKLLCQFLDPYSLGKNLFIYDNPSLVMIENKLLDLNISKNDKFIFISKSGNTIETKYFLNLVIKIFKQKKISSLVNKFIFITENKNKIFYKLGNFFLF